MYLTVDIVWKQIESGEDFAISSGRGARGETVHIYECNLKKRLHPLTRFI